MSNVDYKLIVSMHHGAKIFNVGNNIMVLISLECLPKYSFKDLHVELLGHSPSLENLDLIHIYLILSSYLNFIHVLNMDLLPFEIPFEIPCNLMHCHLMFL